MIQEDHRVRDDLIKRGELFKGYHPEMERVHNENADQLELMIEQHGWPTELEVGKEASHAAWLIVQHAISKSDFQIKIFNILKANKHCDEIKLAHLEDRINIFQGKPQRFGTQFDWDHEGNLSPQLMNHPDEVNKLRRSIGLSSIEEATLEIRARAEKEGNLVPNDFNKRQTEFLLWAKKVGWRK